MTIASYRSRKLLVLLLILVAIGKLSLFCCGYVFDNSIIFSPDSSSYLQTARAFLHTGKFSISLEHPEAPQLMRTPGYPFFIASIFWTIGKESFPVLIFSQILVSLGTIWMTYRLTDMLFGSFAALLSACFLSFDIPSFVHSQKLLTETLFTFFLLVTIFLTCSMLNFSQFYGKAQAFGIGLALALTTLIRPIAYYLIFLGLPGVLLSIRRMHGVNWKNKAAIVLVFILPWIVLIEGWQGRNYLLTGKAEFSYIQGANLLFYRGAGILARRDHIPLERAQQVLGYQEFKALPPEKLSNSIAMLNQQWKRQSLELFLTYPGLLLEDMLQGFLKMFFMPGEDSLFQFLQCRSPANGPIGDFFMLSSRVYLHKWIFGYPVQFIVFLWAGGVLGLMYLTIAFAFWSLATAKHIDWLPHMLIWLVILYFIGISVNPGAYYRFRIPLMPLFSAYAGYGCTRMFSLYQERRRLKIEGC